jgi:cytidylate kinase
MAVITVSRQFGSGGDEICDRVCELLGYRYFDKKLMARVASEVGLSEHDIVDFSEDNYQTQNFLERLMAWRGSRRVGEMRAWGVTSGGVKTREVTELDESSSVAFVNGTIQAAYTRGNVVIVGRGGQAVLKDMPDVLHVRIQAPYNVRVRRLLERENYNPGGAKEAALKHDRASAEYLKRFFDIDWADSTLYDLIINTTKLDIEGSAQLIAKAVTYLPEVESE